MSTDFELLGAWKNGNRTAGNALFDRYFASLYAFFRHKVGDAAEDLVQQTFLSCTQAKQGISGDGNFRSYLFVVAHRKLYTHLERCRRGIRFDPGVTSCEDLGLSPSGVVARNESVEQLLCALRRLPIDLQVALELFYFEQIRGPRLAEILGVPEGTIRSRIRRGRDLLRKELEAIASSKEQVESTLTNLEDWAEDVRQTALSARGTE